MQKFGGQKLTKSKEHALISTNNVIMKTFLKRQSAKLRIFIMKRLNSHA